MNSKWMATQAGLLALCLVFSACTHGSKVRLVDHMQPLDTEWGYPHSEARMEANGGVVFWADAYLQKSGWMRTAVTVDNVSFGPNRLLYRGCPVQVQIFQNENLEGTPVWDSFDRSTPCEPRLKVKTLDVHEEMELSVELNPHQILGDSLQSGTYYVAAVVRPHGIPVIVPAGAVEL